MSIVSNISIAYFSDCNTFAIPISVNPDEQLNNKILGGHGSLSFQLSLNRIVSDVRDFSSRKTGTLGYP
jgi:hypothetical protein